MNLTQIYQALAILMDDAGVPKNVKLRLSGMMSELDSSSNVPIVVNKMLYELEELSNDINLQPFVRTQLWNIASMLETV